MTERVRNKKTSLTRTSKGLKTKSKPTKSKLGRNAFLSIENGSSHGRITVYSAM